MGLNQCLNWLYNRFCGGYVGFCMEFRSYIKSSSLWFYGLNELNGQLVLKQPLFWLNEINLSCCAEVDLQFVWLPGIMQLKNQLNGSLQVSVWMKQLISWLFESIQTYRSYWQLYTLFDLNSCVGVDQIHLWLSGIKLVRMQLIGLHLMSFWLFGSDQNKAQSMGLNQLIDFCMLNRDWLISRTMWLHGLIAMSGLLFLIQPPIWLINSMWIRG